MPVDSPSPSPVADRAVWVVVPLYNEAAVIAGVVRELREHFATVVCVDDGSTDDSAAAAELAGARVVRHPRNLGQGAALQTGIDYALEHDDAEYIVTFDADGQHRVETPARWSRGRAPRTWRSCSARASSTTEPGPARSRPPSSRRRRDHQRRHRAAAHRRAQRPASAAPGRGPSHPSRPGPHGPRD